MGEVQEGACGRGRRRVGGEKRSEGGGEGRENIPSPSSISSSLRLKDGLQPGWQHEVRLILIVAASRRHHRGGKQREGGWRGNKGTMKEEGRRGKM